MTSALSRPLPEFHGFGYRIAQIENNTHCNYKCWFCPNAYDKPAPKECMTLEQFRKILTEIRSVYTPWELNDISFATYNEPNLDDTFKEKLQLMTDLGFEYEHISNGSMITTELTDWLIENPQKIKQFRLNIPTMDEKKWKDITGSSTAVLYRMYYQLMYLFENSQRLNFPITVIVNGDGGDSLEHQPTVPAFKVHGDVKDHAAARTIGSQRLIRRIVCARSTTGVKGLNFVCVRAAERRLAWLEFQFNLDVDGFSPTGGSGPCPCDTNRISNRRFNGVSRYGITVHFEHDGFCHRQCGETPW